MSSAIENLNQFGGQFLKFAWPMLWQSSLLIVLVLMADVLTARKIRASVRHALWLVVLAKLLLPPTLALPTGAAWWLFPAKPVVVPALQTPVANNYTVVVDDAPLPADFVSEPVPIIEPPKPKLTGAGWMLLASGVVSAGLLVWLVFRWGQLAHKVRGATKISKIVSPENMAEVFELARRRAGLRAGARLKLVEGRMSPAVCGLFRPVILLPRLLVEKLAAAQLQAVLLHEMIHLRRGDIWVNCAQSLLQIFYWWHPLVWVANARMRRVREESVDDGVMLALADEAETYAPTLLEVAKLAFRRPLLSLGLVGIMESRSALRQRIERLMDFRAPRKAGLTLVSVCGIFVFSAVAVPMGQGPARMVRETSQTVTVDSSNNIPGTATGILSSPNFQTALRALEQRTGVKNLSEPQITTASGRGENRAGIFPAQEASTEEYRPDFIKENQIGDTPFPKTVIDAGPYSPAEMFAQINQSGVLEHASRTIKSSAQITGGQTTNAPLVLITAQFCRMPAQNLNMLTSRLQFNRGYRSDDSWWSVSSREFGLPRFGMGQIYGWIPFPIELEPSVKLLGRPQILTFAGEEAEMDIGGTNGGLRFDCTPTLENGLVNLAIHAEMIDGAEKNLTTNEFRATAAMENFGGLVIRLWSTNAPGGDELVGIIDVIVATNGPTGNGGEADILVQAGKSLNERHRQSEAESDLKAALAVDPKNSEAKNYLDLMRAAPLKLQADEIKMSKERTKENLDNIRIPEIGFDRLPLGKVVSKLSEAVFKSVNHPEVLKQGFSGQFIGSDFGVDLACTNIVVNMPEMKNARLREVLDAIVLAADKPIQYSIGNNGIVFSARGVTNEIPANDPGGHYEQRLVPITKPAATNDPATSSTNGVMLYMRTFRIDANTFLTKLETNGFLTKLRTQPHPGGSDLSTNSTGAISASLRQLFTDEGVVLTSPPGKSVYYNDRRGCLFVTATEADLDKIERVLQKFLPPPPQLHIKARFISVPQNTMAGLENFLHGLNPANGQFTEILTGTNMRAILQTLASQKGVEYMGEPEITMLSGRRAEMRTTWMMTVVTNLTSDGQGAVVPQTADFELGPILDVTPHVLGDGFTINLKAVPALTEFLGYRALSTSVATMRESGQTTPLPNVSPILQTQKLSVEANLRDNQTLVLGGFASQASPQQAHPKAGDVPVLGRQFRANVVTNDVLVFITATIVDAAGSRVHAEGELAPGQSEIPEQPATTNSGGVEFSTPVPAQLPGHGAIPHGDPGGTDRLLLEGKELYERLKLKEAKAKFTEVIRLETNNATALYYLDAVKQMQTYFLPASSFSPDRGAVFLPVPNAYATNHLIFTGPGRQAIVKKLDTIHIDTVSYDSLPLNEVLKQLATQCRLHDPERKGINFLINNNPDLSAPPGSAVKVASSGPNLDPATGFLLTPAATEPPDVGSYIIKIPSLTDVRMADVLDAITLVSDHPLKYSIQDFAVVFSANSEPQLFMRTFRVDPNTFYSGLENVGALNNNAGAVVGVVNAFSGANGLRNNGGGGSQGGSGSVLKNQTDVGEANEDRNPQSLQGSSYVTAQHPASTPSALARTFFTSLGVNLVDPPGKSVFFNDRLGYLFVKATKTDLDTIEHGLQRLKPAPPPISILHLKAWFLEVPKGTLKDFGKFLNVTNPFDGRPMGILTSQNAKAALQTLQSRKGVEWTGPEVTLFSGCQAEIKSTQVEMIFTNLIVKPPHVTPQTTDLQAGSVLNARSLVLPDGHTINLSGSVSETTFYGYATKPVKQIYITNSVGIPIITNSAGELLSPPMVSPAVEIRRGSALANLYDGQTLVLSGLKPEQARFAEPNAERDAAVAKFIQEAQKKNGEKEIIVFITVNIVDPAGNRVHTDDEMPFAQDGIPPQPAGK